MQLGLIGLGKMGGNMRERIRRAGHEVVGYDRNPEVSDVESLEAMVAALAAPRTVWVMVPAGPATQATVQQLSELLDEGDLVIDGGNSRFTDDRPNAELLAGKGIGYLDCGVSGGIWGLENGYGLMVGGEEVNVERAMPIFDALRPEGPRDEGFVHAGDHGAGHYAKMVHNGIEYGLMAAYAEGYELLEKKDIVKDVPGSFKAWSRGTVVRSWLLDLMVKALEEKPHLEDVSDYTADSGEGRWTVEEAIAEAVPMPVISAALFARFASRQQTSPAMQAVAALRGQFGGHEVMTVADGDRLRAEAAEGVSRPEQSKAAERKVQEPRDTAADEAGPTSGGGQADGRADVHVRHLTVADFRSYAGADLALAPGVTTLVGQNGQGKTNLAEALGYLATLGSHRVATDAPLVRFGAEQAVVRAAVVRDGRESLVELEITPGRANRARLNRSPVARPRDILGTVRTVLFAPEDLALVKGDPGERRRFLDDLLVQRQPRWAGVRSDYDKIVRQRNALLKQSAPVLGRRGRRAPRPGDAPPDEARASALHTLEVWNEHLATVGSQLLYARLRLLRDLRPLLAEAYRQVSDASTEAVATYRAGLRDDVAEAIAGGSVPEVDELREHLLATMADVRDQEVERGVGLVGPHRDEVLLRLGELPAKGYASHGESWSLALSLRLAAYRLLRHDLGDDPVLVLDDVFAELDAGRRERLAEMVADCEQVLITAAVDADIPAALVGPRFRVSLGSVEPEGRGEPDPPTQEAS